MLRPTSSQAQPSPPVPKIAQAYQELVNASPERQEAILAFIFNTQRPPAPAPPAPTHITPAAPDAPQASTPDLATIIFNQLAFLPQYAKEAQDSFKNTKNDAALPDLFPSVPPSRQRDQVIMAPSELRPGNLDHLKAMLANKQSELYAVHKNVLKLPHFWSSRNLHRDLPNEDMVASLIQTHCVEPAGHMLTATANIFMEQEGRIPPHLKQVPTSKLAKALHEKHEFRTITRFDLAPRWEHSHVPLSRLSLGNLWTILRSDPPSDSESDESDRATSSSVNEDPDLIRQWQKITRPDIELVAFHQVSSATDRVLSIEVKRRDRLDEARVRSVLEADDGAFIDDNLQRRLRTDRCFFLREAFQRAFDRRLGSTVFQPAGRYVLECIAKGWEYMASRGQTWGVVTTGWITIILEINWEADSLGDVVNFYIIDDHLEVDLADGTSKITFPEILALLAVANIEAGLRGGEVYIELCRRISEAYEAYTPRLDDRSPDHSSPPARSSPVRLRSATSAQTSAPPPCPQSHPAQPSHDVFAKLSRMQDESIRSRIESVILPDTPGVRFAYSRQQRLARVFQTMRKAKRHKRYDLAEKLRHDLVLSTLDPYANLPVRAITTATPSGPQDQQPAQTEPVLPVDTSTSRSATSLAADAADQAHWTRQHQRSSSRKRSAPLPPLQSSGKAKKTC